jgi:hypothetical protein
VHRVVVTGCRLAGLFAVKVLRRAPAEVPSTYRSQPVT